MTSTPTTPRKTRHILVAALTLTALVSVPAAAADLTPRGAQTDASISASGSGPGSDSGSSPSPASDKARVAENPPPHSGGPGPVYERVAHFYAAYIDVANDPGDNSAAAALRKFYLTSDLRKRLLKWEKQHDSDGILRQGQQVPSAWKVTAGDSGMGHTWSTVRLTWGTGKERTYTYLEVQSDLATRKISDIGSKY